MHLTSRATSFSFIEVIGSIKGNLEAHSDWNFLPVSHWPFFLFHECEWFVFPPKEKPSTLSLSISGWIAFISLGSLEEPVLSFVIWLLDAFSEVLTSLSLMGFSKEFESWREFGFLNWRLWKYYNTSLCFDAFFPWPLFDISLNISQLKYQ